MTTEVSSRHEESIATKTVPWHLIALGILLVNTALLVLALSVAQARGLDPKIFYQDPATAAKAGFYTGWISSLGAALWIGSGAAALFGGLLARRWDCTVLGLLTLCLGMDDLLLLHEGVLRWVHIPEVVALLAYAIAGLFWFFRLRVKTFDGTIVFVAAGFLLVASGMVDELGWLLPLSASMTTVAEEVVKELGLFLWAAGTIGYAVMAVGLGQQEDRSA